jgi:hypothetical protein
VCTVFARLVDALRGHPDKLREIAGANYALFTNVQQLVTIYIFWFDTFYSHYLVARFTTGNWIGNIPIADSNASSYVHKV